MATVLYTARPIQHTTSRMLLGTKGCAASDCSGGTSLAHELFMSTYVIHRYVRGSPVLLYRYGLLPLNISDSKIALVL
jgi:hypothetical protein